MVEKELSEIIQQYKDETRILRGVALDSDAYSYVDRFQQIAELEASLKVERLERDMPKYVRAQRKYIKQLDDSVQDLSNSAAEALGVENDEFLRKEELYYGGSNLNQFTRESIEDVMSRQYMNIKMD